jgi:hypothetical protein
MPFPLPFLAFPLLSVSRRSSRQLYGHATHQLLHVLDPAWARSKATRKITPVWRRLESPTAIAVGNDYAHTSIDPLLSAFSSFFSLSNFFFLLSI